MNAAVIGCEEIRLCMGHALSGNGNFEIYGNGSSGRQGNRETETVRQRQSESVSSEPPSPRSVIIHTREIEKEEAALRTWVG